MCVQDIQREGILHRTPTERRYNNQSFILFERLGGLRQGPIMIWYVYEAAGVHHSKFDNFSTTKGGLCISRLLNVMMISEGKSQEPKQQ